MVNCRPCRLAGLAMVNCRLMPHLTVLTIPKRLLSMPPALLLGLLEVEEEEDKVGEGCDSFNTSQWGPWI